MKLYPNKNLCCGCSACVNVCGRNAIEMKEDSEGFLYPHIKDELCVNCGKCKNVCPLQTERINQESPKRQYGFKHKSVNTRENSSSGGFFSAISDYVLDNSGVVFGAAYSSDHTVVHMRAETKEERDKLRGSKYVQSEIRDVFAEVKQELGKDRLVLFSGTPCQISGLRKFIGNSDNLITCDVICHGVPSPLIWKDFLKVVEKKEASTVLKAQTRDVSNRWGEHITTLEMSNGKVIRTREYLDLFFSNNMLRPACHKCKFATLNRDSDFTLADFWGVDKRFPEFKDDCGVSYVLLNTDRAVGVFEKIKSFGDVVEAEIKDTVQPQLYSPAKTSLVRKLFWRDYRTKGIEFVIEKYAVNKFGANIKVGIYKALKKLGATKLIGK